MSLRRRVLVGFLAVAVVLVGANVALFGTFRSFLLDRIDRQLATAGAPLAARPLLGAGGRVTNPALAEEVLTEYFIAAGDPAAGTLTRFTSALAEADRPGPDLEVSEIVTHLTPSGEAAVPWTASAQSGGGRWRLVALEGPRGRLVVVVGLDLEELEATLARIRFVQLTATALVLAALGAVSWWMLRLGVHPLAAMAETADAIAAGDLSRRVEHVDERTEVGRFGVALNAMLARIEQAFRAREESEERVRQFAADASHELRTPLTSIRGYAELWRAGGLRREEELADAMRRTEEEAARMGALVEDLLLLARFDREPTLELATVRLDELAADGVRDARAVEPDRPFEVRLEPVTVEGDPVRLRQVVANLLANARVHTPASAGVRVAVRASGDRGVLEVEDDGPGMDAETTAHVFDRFFRSDASRTRDVGGSGLGLAIVAAVAAAHGGSARAESFLGRGSRFTVEIPVSSSAGVPTALDEDASTS